MNWKLVVLGGLAFYIVTWLMSMVTGPLVHQGVLKPTYQDNAEYWRPELNADPPDMAALMPRWIVTGLISAFLISFVYCWVRPALVGPGWRKGMMYGFGIWLLAVGSYLGWSGVFGLPDALWVWWGTEALFFYVLGGAALGWVGGKWAPEAVA